MAEPLKTLETIDLLYQAALEPQLWPRALHEFARATGGFGTAMIPITPGNITGLIVSPDLTDSRPDYDRHWHQYDTRVRRIFSRKLTDGVCCEAELFTEDEIRRDPMRQEFCRPYDMGAFAAQLVMPFPDVVVAFSVQRAVKQGHFDASHLATLKLLGRHAARALLISVQLSTARRLGQTVADALAQFECAAMVLDHGMKILFANEASERLIGDGLSVRYGTLSASHRKQQGEFERFLSSVLRSDTDLGELGPIALQRPGARRPLLVQAIPIKADPNALGLDAGPAILLIVVDPENDRGYDATKTLRLLGLTAAEARLAMEIGAGRSRTEAAERLGLSPATVADTAKQIYAKLDISNQSSLVRLVSRLTALRGRS